MPLTIRFGEEELEDRRQLTPEEFWGRCQGKGDLPETAAPSPGSFVTAYQQAADEGAEAVLCLTLSSGVSGTYGSAVTAAEYLRRRAGTRRRHPFADHGPGPHGHRRGRGGGGRRRPRHPGRGHPGPDRPGPGLRRAGRARLPPARWPHRRCPGAAGLAPLHQAGDPGQGRRGGRGVQAADPLAGAGLHGRQGGRRRPAGTTGRGRRRLRRHRRRADADQRPSRWTIPWSRSSSGRSSARTPAPTPWASVTSFRPRPAGAGE